MLVKGKWIMLAVSLLLACNLLLQLALWSKESKNTERWRQSETALQASRADLAELRRDMEQQHQTQERLIQDIQRRHEALIRELTQPPAPHKSPLLDR